MGLSAYFTVNKADMTLTSVNGSQIMLMGLDDVEKLKSIHGITDIWIEEATEATPDDLKQLNLRLRGQGPQKRIILTFNPINQTHWLKAYFFDNPKDNARITRTTHLDNAFLDEEYHKELLALKDEDPYYYSVYALGEWGVLGNVVFTNVVIEDFEYTEDDFENVCEGMDFGFVHASTIVRLGFRDGEIYAFDELYGKGWTNPDFLTYAGEHFGDARYRMRLTADSAEPDRIEEWNRAGWNVTPAKKGAGSVRFGIDYLAAKKWHIHASRCPNLAREVQSFKRREDKDGNALDAFVEFNDDAIAAARYATEYLWGQYHGVVADYDIDVMAQLGL
jgi:phage terminase large subunit